MASPMPSKRTKLTVDDWELLPEDGKQHEIIDGELFVMSAPFLVHQRIAARLFSHLSRFVEEHRLGNIYFSPLGVILSEHNVVEPDLAYISNERSAIEQDWVRGAPDLAVEILSASTRKKDETLKRRLYERFGVREYWIVDPELETVKVYVDEGGRFAPAELLATEEGATLTTPLLPGLEIEVASLFDQRRSSVSRSTP